MRLLEMVGLAEDARTKVANYSKGMQMRLNFARSLLHRPEILFLDEPTSGMDPANARKLKDLILEEKKKGHTVFLTTHNMFIADELCDRVAFIVEGKIVLIDSPNRLKLEHGERAIAVSYMKDNQVKKEKFFLEGLGENSTFLQIIRQEKLQTIHTMEPSLEDIFIKVTGRQLV
ncbi:Fluoroquinolones export ATP-binding protein [Pelotomaculum sp. FP]|uniref:AAA family ATPase n=1 Tax=Pelotomaculum sp. FP TaxID=261474 RepID=UPI00110095FF|nr:Fluoroquinolones export ATP-binding protein [Pelotomaculum sp. FP]